MLIKAILKVKDSSLDIRNIYSNALVLRSLIVTVNSKTFLIYDGDITFQSKTEIIIR